MNPEGDEYDPEEDEDSLEPSWPHLCLVYDMFIKFLELPQFNSNLARKYIDLSFVTRLMALFDLEDPRERDIVKTALHRIYGKFLNLRPFIRKMMRSIFCELVYENVRHKIAEMLEILGRYPRLSIFIVCIKHCFSIINGFALPIRPEHRFFLEKSLIPLHKHRSLPCYQPQLAFCINQFIEKDQDLADMVVMGLLRIWPKINSNKEVLFLTEIEEILGMLDPEYFEPFAEPLFDRLALCIESCHFQVCEKALMFWHNDDVLELFKTQYQAMIEIVTPSILARSSTHWNSSVRLLMIGVLHIFVKLDAKLFEDCAFQYAIESHIDPIAERTEISNLLNIDLRAAANSDYPSGMDISRSDGESEKENPAGDLQEILPLIPGSVVRRKSMLPVDKDIAEALSNFRPSPPPSDIPDKGIII